MDRTHDAAVLAIGDDPLLGERLCNALPIQGKPAGLGSHGARAIQRIHETDWDVVVTVPRIPEVDGLMPTRAIHRRRPHIPVIVVMGGENPGSAVCRPVGKTVRISGQPFIMREHNECFSDFLRGEVAARHNLRFQEDDVSMTLIVTYRGPCTYDVKHGKYPGDLMFMHNSVGERTLKDD